jgi:hypothetical protein
VSPFLDVSSVAFDRLRPHAALRGAPCRKREASERAFAEKRAQDAELAVRRLAPRFFWSFLLLIPKVGVVERYGGGLGGRVLLPRAALPPPRERLSRRGAGFKVIHTAQTIRPRERRH